MMAFAPLQAIKRATTTFASVDLTVTVNTKCFWIYMKLEPRCINFSFIIYFAFYTLLALHSHWRTSIRWPDECIRFIFIISRSSRVSSFSWVLSHKNSLSALFHSGQEKGANTPVWRSTLLLYYSFPPKRTSVCVFVPSEVMHSVSGYAHTFWTFLAYFLSRKKIALNARWCWLCERNTTCRFQWTTCVCKTVCHSRWFPHRTSLS